MEALWKVVILAISKISEEENNERWECFLDIFLVTCNTVNSYRCSMDSRIYEYTWKLSNLGVHHLTN